MNGQYTLPTEEAARLILQQLHPNQAFDIQAKLGFGEILIQFREKEEEDGTDVH